MRRYQQTRRGKIVRPAFVSTKWRDWETSSNWKSRCENGKVKLKEKSIAENLMAEFGIEKGSVIPEAYVDFLNSPAPQVNGTTN